MNKPEKDTKADRTSSLSVCQTTPTYRVFLCYSHHDKALMERVSKVLREQLGAEPSVDTSIRPGMLFTDEIRGLISHAHIFMPLLTDDSRQRPWVQQETGYAIALGIPVLPLAIGDWTDSGEMIAQLQAIPVPSEEQLEEVLSQIELDHVVNPMAPLPQVMEVAEYPEDRARQMALAMKRIESMKQFGMVRQRGAMTSLSIPDRDLSDDIWREREGDHQRSDYLHDWQREERRAFERHIRAAGCKLVIDPALRPELRPVPASLARFRTLQEALKGLQGLAVPIELAAWERHDAGSLTIVGDWFTAESRAPRRGGYFQTVFNWHAPTVLRSLQAYDCQFAELQQRCGWDDGQSLEKANEAIAETIANSAKDARLPDG